MSALLFYAEAEAGQMTIAELLVLGDDRRDAIIERLAQEAAAWRRIDREIADVLEKGIDA